MQIYETNGARYRVREKEIKTRQTDSLPRIEQLRREFAEHPSSGLTPQGLAVILKDAEQGNLLSQSYLAEDIEEKDGHIQAEIFKRRMAITGEDFNVVAPANASAQEKQDAAEIEQMLRDIEDWHSILFGLGDGILKGFSNVEYTWQRYQNWQIPHGFEHRPATWFQLHQDDQDVIALRDSTGKGEILRPFNWLQHRHPSKSGYAARIGLVRQLAWPFIFKNYSVRDLAEFLEIYGIPVKIGKYPSGATPEERQRLMAAVVGIGHNAGGIIPKGMEIDFHEAAKGGGSDPFLTMMSWCERTMSKAILGQTLTSQVDSTGSQALGNVHNEVRQDIRDHDLRQLSSTINRDLIQPMYMLNGKSYKGDPRRKPRLIFDTQEPEDLKLYADSLPSLVSMGMKVPVSYAHEKLRIPVPEANEPILSMTPAPAQEQPDNTDKQALKRAIAALKATRTPPQDGADVFTSQLKAKSKPVFDRLMLPIEQLVANAESLEQLLDALLELDDSLDMSELEEVLAPALAAAELAGRYDVDTGN